MMRRDEPATMMHLIRPLLLLLGVALLLIVAERANGDSVRIHDQTGSDGPEVTLSQVAELDGEYANRFADVVVGRFDADENRVEIEASAIVKAIREQGAKLGLLDLQGFGRCTVHRTFTEPAQAEKSASEPAIANADANGADLESPAEPVTVYTPTTVRALIEQAIRQRIGIDGASLEIRFSERDEELLNSSAVAGRYEVEPVVEPTLGRVSFNVYAFNGTKRVGGGQIVRVDISRRVVAVIAGEAITRGTLINRRQVRLREVLVNDPTQTYLTETSLVVGQVASKSIKPGALVTAEEIKMPTAVGRRERVSVELRSPGVKITFIGMAMGEGAVGEVIEVENMKTGERFSATIVGRGKVVAGIQSKKTKE